MYPLKNKFVLVPNTVNCYIDGVFFCFDGPIGKIKHKLPDVLNIYIKDSKIFIEKRYDILNVRDYLHVKSLLSTTFILFKNYINGVLRFYEKVLILKGIGYKTEFGSNKSVLIMNVGYSHPIVFNIPDDIEVELVTNTEIKVKGVSKYLVGQVAANIRSVKLPDSYKGNGVRYKDEKIILKVPKKTK